MANSQYPLPTASVGHETARLNVQHEMLLLPLNGELLASPLPPASNRIKSNQHVTLRVADLGTGTGILGD